MKKTFMTLLSTFVLLLCIFTVSAMAEEISPQPVMPRSGLSWHLENETLTITGQGALPNWPSKEYTPWYQYSYAVRVIVVEEGVTSIGDYSFDSCSYAQSLSLPNGLTYIGKSAFKNCQALRNITIPNTVTSIEDNAFSMCLGITSIQIPDGITTINANTFKFCRNLTQITLPDSLTTIKENAFEYCDSLNEIMIPGNVTMIEQYAFKQCEGLRKISLPSRLSVIKTGTFLNCRKLEDIIIPNQVTNIEDSVFKNCDSLVGIVTSDNVISIGADNFSGSSNTFFCGKKDSYVQTYAAQQGKSFYNIFLYEKMKLGDKIQLPQGVYNSAVSSNTGVISVSQTGLLEAKTLGKTVITITINNHSIKFPVEVKENLYKLTVINGTGNGVYESGAQVPIKTNPNYSQFVKWIVQSGNSALTNTTSNESSITIGTNNTIVIAASYENALPEFSSFKLNESKYYCSRFNGVYDDGLPMVIVNAKSFIPMRTVAYTMGATVDYYEANNKAYVMVTYGQRKVEFILNETTAKIYDISGNLLNTVTIPSTEAPILINGRTYLSARALHNLCFMDDYSLCYQEVEKGTYVMFAKGQVTDAQQRDMTEITSKLINF